MADYRKRAGTCSLINFYFLWFLLFWGCDQKIFFPSKRNNKKNQAVYPIEAIMWIVILVALMFNDPYDTGAVSLCPFHNMGLDFCPGCGLGTSISLAFRGQLEASLNAHPLGIIAILILTSRIYTLIKTSFKESFTQRNHG